MLPFALALALLLMLSLRGLRGVSLLSSLSLATMGSCHSEREALAATFAIVVLVGVACLKSAVLLRLHRLRS